MRKILGFVLGLSCVFLFLSGCAPLIVNTALNHDFSTKTYSHLLVISFDQDQETAENLEEAAYEHFKDSDKHAIQCNFKSKLFYAGSNISQKAVKDNLDAYIEKHSIDGVLIVSDGTLKFEEEPSVGGYYKALCGAEMSKNLPSKDGLSVELFDAKSRTSVWYSRYNGIALTTYDLEEKLVIQSLEQMEEIGLIASVVPKEK